MTANNMTRYGSRLMPSIGAAIHVSSNGTTMNNMTNSGMNIGMRSLLPRLRAAWVVTLALAPLPALAQSAPGFVQGQVPTATQWNSYFAAKVDLSAAPSVVTSQAQLTTALAAGGAIYIPPATTIQITGTKTISVAGTTLYGPGTIQAASGFTASKMIQVSASNVTLDVALDGQSSVNHPIGGISGVVVSGGNWDSVRTGPHFSVANVFGIGVDFDDNSGSNAFTNVYLDHPVLTNVGWAGINMTGVTGTIVAPSVTSTGWDVYSFRGRNKVSLIGAYATKATRPTNIYNGAGSFGGIEGGAFVGYFPTDILQIDSPVFDNNLNAGNADCIQFEGEDGTAVTGAVHITNPHITSCQGSVDLTSNSTLTGGLINATWGGLYITYDAGGTTQNVTNINVSGTTISNTRAHADSIAIVAGGSGYVVNDVACFANGLCANITGVAAGVVNAVTIYTAGSFNATGTIASGAQSYGLTSGTGLTLNATVTASAVGIKFASANASPVVYNDITVNAVVSDTRSPQPAPNCAQIDNTVSLTFHNVTVGGNCTDLTRLSFVGISSAPSGFSMAAYVNGELDQDTPLNLLIHASAYGNNQTWSSRAGDITGQLGTNATGPNATGGYIGTVSAHGMAIRANAKDVIVGCVGGGGFMADATGAAPTGNCGPVGSLNLKAYPQIDGKGIVLTGTTGSISGALAAGACNSGTASVTGARSTMAVAVSAVTQPQADDTHGLSISALVSADDTVTVKECALVATTPNATAFNVRVIQ